MRGGLLMRPRAANSTPRHRWTSTSVTTSLPPASSLTGTPAASPERRYRAPLLLQKATWWTSCEELPAALGLPQTSSTFTVSSSVGGELSWRRKLRVFLSHEEPCTLKTPTMPLQLFMFQTWGWRVTTAFKGPSRKL